MIRRIDPRIAAHLSRQRSHVPRGTFVGATMDLKNYNLRQNSPEQHHRKQPKALPASVQKSVQAAASHAERVRFR
jgi:hypothetical protein